ncbi:MAG: AraC family transcriptional regulator [Oscillospiraceae bacterium]|nr:AraC family transcriptional regulator [Oscillospiraceae bacterium]
MILLEKYNDELFNLRSIGQHDSREGRDSHFFRSKTYWALHYVQRGSGKLFVRKQQYDIKSGMFFLTPPLEPVNYYADDNNPWKYFFVSGYPDSAIDILTALGFSSNNFAVSAKHPQKIFQIFSSFFMNAEDCDDLYFSALNTLHKILSIEFSKPQDDSRRRNATDIINSIEDIMLFNYKNPEFSVSDIADMLYMAPSQLSRIFKRETGETPISHLINLRLDYAASLLQNRSYNISELCNHCGFCDEHYFMKRFKNKFGMTVGEYRKHITGHN